MVRGDLVARDHDVRRHRREQHDAGGLEVGATDGAVEDVPLVLCSHRVVDDLVPIDVFTAQVVSVKGHARQAIAVHLVVLDHVVVYGCPRRCAGEEHTCSTPGGVDLEAPGAVEIDDVVGDCVTEDTSDARVQAGDRYEPLGFCTAVAAPLLCDGSVIPHSLTLYETVLPVIELSWLGPRSTTQDAVDVVLHRIAGDHRVGDRIKQDAATAVAWIQVWRGAPRGGDVASVVVAHGIVEHLDGYRDIWRRPTAEHARREHSNALALSATDGEALDGDAGGHHDDPVGQTASVDRSVQTPQRQRLGNQDILSVGAVTHDHAAAHRRGGHR